MLKPKPPDHLKKDATNAPIIDVDKLITLSNQLTILNQNTLIQILDVERIIINSRFDNITEVDVEKAKKFFALK